MIPSFDKANLFEKQQFYYNGFLCPYCSKESELVDSSIIYMESHGMIFFCKDCLALVNTKHGDQALGPLAKKPLRKLRSELYELFERLFAIKVARGGNKIQAQKKAATWMAEILKIDRTEAHIGYLFDEQCKIIIAELNKLFLTPEQKIERQKIINQRIEVVNFLSGFMGFEARHFKAGALNKIELVHPVSQKVFDYFPETNLGQWQGKKGKTRPVEDIEKFIEEHFKTKAHAGNKI